MTSPYGNRLSPNMYWPAPERDTDTTSADNQQLAGILDAMQRPAAAQADDITALAREYQEVHGYDPATARAYAEIEAHEAATLPLLTETAEQGDPQWAGPSLPHPSEATSEAEADELRQGWDDWQHGIEPNQEQLEA